MLSENIRKLGFWISDYLKGGLVAAQYKRISAHMLFPDSEDPFKNGDLKNLLDHAVSTVPFYKKYTGYCTVNDFPVINKTIVRNDQENFFSENFTRDELKKLTTSGSTGAPFSVYHDRFKRIRHSAENIFLSGIGGSDLGTRIYYLRVWNRINKKSMVTAFLQNIKMIDASNLSDDFFTSLLNRLQKDSSNKTILAFATTLEALAIFLNKQKPDNKIKLSVIFSISESLPEASKKVLEDFFRCKVICRYSNIENGFIAQQCGHDSGEYHINTQGFFIEILHPDKDEPVGEGESGRVVVTDKFNYGMPLIRYDTGDLAVHYVCSQCGKPGPVFSRIDGRKVDFIFSADGELLSPHAITNTMWKYSNEIRQFQFVQKGASSYTICLNLSVSDFQREKELIYDLKHFVGESSKIEVRYEAEIPVLASGKRRKIINEYKK
jgi:phenylacetate-CoA ligase